MISAINGENVVNRSKKITWYKGPAFLETLDSLKNRHLPEDKPLIFPVQDVYKMNGKRIVVGRIEAGTIKQGQIIKILPSNRITQVKSIEKYLEDIDTSYVGESTGITTQEPVSINRGDVLCLPDEEPVLTDKFSVNIFWVAKRDFIKGEHIILRCATQETTCKIETIKKRINSIALEVIE